MYKYILISLKTIPFEKSNIDNFVYNLSDIFFTLTEVDDLFYDYIDLKSYMTEKNYQC